MFEAEFTHVLSLHEDKTINIDQKVVDNTKRTDTTGTACTTPGLPVGCNMNFGNVNLIRPLSDAFAAAWSAGAGQFAQ